MGGRNEVNDDREEKSNGNSGCPISEREEKRKRSHTGRIHPIDRIRTAICLICIEVPRQEGEDQ
jgi:hypothetical protein